MEQRPVGKFFSGREAESKGVSARGPGPERSRKLPGFPELAPLGRTGPAVNGTTARFKIFSGREADAKDVCARERERERERESRALRGPGNFLVFPNCPSGTNGYCRQRNKGQMGSSSLAEKQTQARALAGPALR